MSDLSWPHGKQHQQCTNDPQDTSLFACESFAIFKPDQNNETQLVKK